MSMFNEILYSGSGEPEKNMNWQRAEYVQRLLLDHCQNDSQIFACAVIA